MARETGIVIDVTPATPPATVPTKGFVQRDDLTKDPNTPEFDDPSLATRNIVLKVDDKVSFEVGADNIARNIALAGTVDPDFPANNEGDLYVPTPGDLNISGRTVTVRGTTVNGNVNITNGGKLILTSDDQNGTTKGKVTGTIDGRQNSTLIIYQSIVSGNIFFHNNAELKVKGGSVGGDMNVHTVSKVAHGGSVGGDVDVRSSSNVTISGLTITGVEKSLTVKNNKISTVVKDVTVNNGDVEIKNNAGCSYSNINTPNGAQDISGCP